MPSRIDLVVEYTDGSERAYNTFSYYSIAGFSSAANMLALAQAFETNVLPLWAGFMTDNITFETITARSPSFPFPTVITPNLAGDLADTDVSILPAWIPLVLKKNVVGNTDGDTGGAYLGLRPVRGGRVFLSWMLETFSTRTGFVNPGGVPGTAWTDFLAELDDSVVAAGDTYFPVVPGDTLPASGSLPARTSPVMGNIASFSPGKFTKLSTRDD